MDYSFHSSPYMLFVTPMHFVVFWQHLQKGKGLHAARPAKWHDTDSFLSSPSHEARRNTIICNSLPGPATVMTGGTNDTPLIEPPGADNMPNRRKGLCHKPIVSEICCRVIASADQRPIENLKALRCFYRHKYNSVLTCLAFQRYKTSTSSRCHMTGWKPQKWKWVIFSARDDIILSYRKSASSPCYSPV